jgi:hypothetical protein
VAVVVLARIDWGANEAITGVASLASANVVVHVADEARVAAGVFVATSFVDGARVDLNAFGLKIIIELVILIVFITYSFLDVSVVADALVSISSCEGVTGGVEWADAGVRAVADAFVSDRSVDALGILVALVLVGVEALVDWADKSLIT